MEPVHLKLLLLVLVLVVARVVATFTPGIPPKVKDRICDGCDMGMIASLVSFLLVVFVFQLSRVEGDSMLPSLHDAEYTIVNKLIYRFHAPQRGDIIVFQSPKEQGDYIKRIIALPDETVSVEDGWVKVNGLRLNEPYELEMPEDYPPMKVPPGTVFVMGDNRRNSTDSRVFGPLSKDLILGKASFIIWPPGRWGFIQSFRGRRFRA